MARQSAPQTYRIAVDATADLTTLFDARMADGTDCWVNAAGVTHGKWCLDKTSVLVVNGTTVIATLSGVGRWIFFGSGGGSTAFEWFETLADAAAAAGPAVKTGAIIAETNGEYEFVPGDVTAIDGWTVIGNTGGTNGRWLLKDNEISIAPTAGNQGARISAALAATAGKADLILRDGTFQVSTSISISAAFTTLKGQGIIQATAANIPIITATGIGNIRISDVTLFGFASGNVLATTESAILLQNCTDVQVRNVRFSFSRGAIVYAINCEDLWIEDNRATAPFLGAVLRGCRRGGFRRNILRDSGASPAVFSIGLHFDANDYTLATTTTNTAMPAVGAAVVVHMTDTSWIIPGQTVYIAGLGTLLAAAPSSGVLVSLTNIGEPENAAPATVVIAGARVSAGPCYDMDATGNVWKNFTSWQCFSIDSGVRLRIENNDLFDVFEGISSDNADAGDLVRDIVVIGNTVQCTTTGGQLSGSNYGIRFRGSLAAPAPNPTDVVVVGNTVRNANAILSSNVSFAPSAYAGIYFERCDGVTCSGNVVESAYGTGIGIGSAVTGMSGEGNIIRNTQAATAGGGVQQAVSVNGYLQVGAAPQGSLGVVVDQTTLGAGFGVVGPAAPASPNFRVSGSFFNCTSGKSYRGLWTDTAGVKPTFQFVDLTRPSNFPMIGKYTAGDTTPDVTGVGYMVIANAGATVITDFLGGVTGQDLTLVFRDANTTVTQANSVLPGAVPFVSAQYKVLRLVKTGDAGSYWTGIASTVNG